MDNKLNEKNNFIIYTTDDGQVDIEVRLEDENVWLIAGGEVWRGRLNQLGFEDR